MIHTLLHLYFIKTGEMYIHEQILRLYTFIPLILFILSFVQSACQHTLSPHVQNPPQHGELLITYVCEQMCVHNDRYKRRCCANNRQLADRRVAGKTLFSFLRKVKQSH